MTATQIIGKCSNGHVVRGTFDDVKGGWITCPCGRQAVAKWMRTSTTEKTCNSVCMGSTGTSCSCSCGGENHGRAKVFHTN